MPRADRVHSTQRTRAPAELRPARASANWQTPTFCKFAEGSPDQAANLPLDPADRTAGAEQSGNWRLDLEGSANLPTRTFGKFAEGSVARGFAIEKGAKLHPSDAVPDGPVGLSDAPGGKDPAELLATLQRLRSAATAEVERLITFLDETEGDADLEPSGDEAEPELGSIEGGNRKNRFDQTAWAAGVDGEPSLGAPENHPEPEPWEIHTYGLRRSDDASQRGWSAGGDDEREHCADLDEDDSHDGCEPDDGDDEPALGSFDRMTNQDHAYRQTSGASRRMMFGTIIDAEIDAAL